jgi:hypothetical protein
MTRKLVRSLAAALLLAGLAAPAVAWPKAALPEQRPSFFVQVWERLAAPFAALFAADEPNGRSIWDPDGVKGGDPGSTSNSQGTRHP